MTKATTKIGIIFGRGIICNERNRTTTNKKKEREEERTKKYKKICAYVE
jgi:hypothetical protein